MGSNPTLSATLLCASRRPGTGQHARSRKCENANPRPRMRERACQENDAEISLGRLGGGEELLFAVDFESGDRALTFS